MMDTAATKISSHPVHPLGSRARVLLTSIFGPYAREDGYGSREINPMELYHHQVTRVQGAFSLRTFHRSWGLMMIQANIQAECTLLDYPTLERFQEELKAHRYDVIGISAIPTNLMKVRKMCKVIRKAQPEATIVIGGHISAIPDLGRWCDADHIVRGEGIGWMRRFLGEDESAPVRHIRVRANLRSRMMGISLDNNPTDAAATLIPAVGCPMGCNFCATSAMFGGKGHSVTFLHDAEEIFRVMCELEESLQVQAFFVMDENFLLDRKRTLRLLALMEEHSKPWSLYVFSSANVLSLYTPEELVRIGVSWVWIGLEGKDSAYAKLKSADTQALVKELQSHGIRFMGSSIIGLEDHSDDNIDAVIDYAVAHDTEFHQFMLYTPTPGTPLHEELQAQGALKSVADMNVSDMHGQGFFSFHHPHITEGMENEYLLRAFRRDFTVNGPSIVRICRTTLRGWLRHRNHPDPRVRARFAHEAANLPVRFPAIVWAARERLREDPRMEEKLTALLQEFYQALGLRTRLVTPLAGRYVLRCLRREEERLAGGWTYEPPTFYETRAAVGA